MYGVSSFETVHLQCDVDANPPQVSFNWKLQSNSFLESFHQINDTRYLSQKLRINFKENKEN